MPILSLSDINDLSDLKERPKIGISQFLLLVRAYKTVQIVLSQRIERIMVNGTQSNYVFLVIEIQYMRRK